MTDPNAALPARLVKYYESALQDGPCAANEVIALVTTDRADRDKEVLLPGGARLDNFRANPRVMYGHAKGLPSEGEAGLPVGKAIWIKPTRDGHGLVAKIAFDLDDPYSARVCGKVKRGYLVTHSITFTPIKYGPPTADELKARPDWVGVKCVYREWELVEDSVVAFPANVDAMTLVKTGDKTVDSATPNETETAPEPEPEAADPTPAPEPEPEPVMKALPAPAHEDEDDAEEEEEGPLRNGHFVKVVKGPHKGVVGKVKSVHRGGLVPDVDDDVPASKAEPGMRVCAYKAMGDGFKETAHHVGVKMAHAERIDELKPPKKAKAAPAPQGWTEAERAAYRAALVSSPEFRERLEKRVAERYDVKVMGKV